MKELYQMKITKIKTILWNTQHICKNAKANLYPDGEETVAAELQAAIDNLVKVEKLIGELHRDILQEAGEIPIASYTR